MTGIKKPSFNRSKFRKVLTSKTDLRIKNDQSDVLIYLVYTHYLTRVLKESRELQDATGNSEISPKLVNEACKTLAKVFKG